MARTDEELRPYANVKNSLPHSVKYFLPYDVKKSLPSHVKFCLTFTGNLEKLLICAHRNPSGEFIFYDSTGSSIKAFYGHL